MRRGAAPIAGATALALGAFVAPAPSAAAQPAPRPWSVEAPLTLDGRFGLGVDVLLADFEDLAATAGRQVISVRGPDGGEQVTEVPFDPDLDDRKHGRDWEERTVGVQVPIALPTLRLGPLPPIATSLVVEGAVVDGRFELRDLVEGAPRRRLEGSGARWGVGVEALGGLCSGCRWFWSAGYRFRTLSGLDLDEETPPPDVPLDDPVPDLDSRGELESDVHHVTARLGAVVGGGRATVYVGARGRRGELVLADETTLRSPQGGQRETTVSTRIELETDDTAALAGVDLRLGRRFVGRVEATFGGGGDSMLLKVVSVHGRRPRKPGAGDPADDVPPPHVETPREIAEQLDRAEALAAEIAPQVAELRERFRAERAALDRRTGPGPALDPAAVRRLAALVERELRRILDDRDLQPILAAYLHVVGDAELDARGLGATRTTGPAAAYRLASLGPAPQPTRESRDDRSPGLLDRIDEFLTRLWQRADARRLTQAICVLSKPTANARVALSAAVRGARVVEQTTVGKLHVFYRGYYAWRASLRGQLLECAADSDPAECGFIDLWHHDGPLLVCDFRRGREGCRLAEGDAASCVAP